MRIGIKKLRLGLMVLLSMGVILGCQKTVQFEDNPNQRAAVKIFSQHYIQALVNLDFDRIVAMSDVPFVGEDKVFNSKDELKQAIIKNNDASATVAVNVDDIKIYTVEDIQKAEGKLWQLLEKHHLLKDLYVVKMALDVGGHQEQGVLAVKLDENGEWKVIGVFE